MQVPSRQALYDIQFLYGIIASATPNISQKTILKYEHGQDGVLAWHELKQDFAFNGSRELRLERTIPLRMTQLRSKLILSTPSIQHTKTEHMPLQMEEQILASLENMQKCSHILVDMPI